MRKWKHIYWEQSTLPEFKGSKKTRKARKQNAQYSESGSSLTIGTLEEVKLSCNKKSKN